MEDISTIFLMLAKTFCLLYFVLMLWFIRGWNKLPEFNAIPENPAIAGIGIVVYMTNFSIALTGFLSIIFYPYFSIAPLLLIFCTKCLIDFLFLNLPTGFFKRRDLLLYFFRGQLFVIIYTIFILPLSMKGV